MFYSRLIRASPQTTKKKEEKRFNENFYFQKEEEEEEISWITTKDNHKIGELRIDLIKNNNIIIDIGDKIRLKFFPWSSRNTTKFFRRNFLSQPSKQNANKCIINRISKTNFYLISLDTRR